MATNKWVYPPRSPHHERPRDGDHLVSVGGKMRLLGIKLTPMVRAHELDGVSYGHWPVEALSESVPYEGPWSSVVATSPECRSSRSFRPSSMVMQRCKIPVELRRYISLPVERYGGPRIDLLVASNESGSRGTACASRTVDRVIVLPPFPLQRQSNSRSGRWVAVLSTSAPKPKSTDGSCRSLENASGGTVLRVEAILESSSAASL